MPAISIIIPTYNRAHLITRSIQSVINQTSSDWELIVVDDGSTDDTPLIVEQYLSEKIKYLRQPNGGANRARNLGAKHATFSYLAFLDSDDELYPGWLATFQAVLTNDVSIACCGTSRITGSKENNVMPKSLGKIFDDGIGKFTNGACYVIKKNLFFEVGGFDEELKSGQHTELSFRLAAKILSKEIHIVNIFQPLVKIHIHDGPRIRNNADSKFRGALRVLQKHAVLLGRDPKLKRDYAKIVVLHAFNKRHFAVAIRSFVTFCKYSILAKFSFHSNN